MSYSSSAPTSSSMAAHSTSKRRDMDLMKLMMSDFQVHIPDESRLHEFWVVFHGPPETPYHGGQWKVHVALPPDYPFKSPSIGFTNRLFHPNVDEMSGSVCLDVINQAWTPMYDLVNVFEAFLPQLLRYPNPSDPLNPDAAHLLLRDPEKYHARVQDYVRRFASVSFFLSEEEAGGGRGKAGGREGGRTTTPSTSSSSSSLTSSPASSSSASAAQGPRPWPAQPRQRQPSMSSSVATTASAALSSSLTPSTDSYLFSSSASSSSFRASPASSPSLRPRDHPRSASLGVVPTSSLSTRPTPMVVSSSQDNVGNEDVKLAPPASVPSTEAAVTKEGEEEEGMEEGEEEGGGSDIDSDVSELSDIDI